MVDRSKSEQYKNHPLNGIGLKALLKLLVDHYGWETLDQQININCFKSKPSIASSYKFLHRTQWAREKVEAFYLYKYMQFPRPTDEQHKYSPRERDVDPNRMSETPAVIDLKDSEFFDDPISGPVFPSKKSVTKTRAQAKKKSPSALAKEGVGKDPIMSSKDAGAPSESTRSRRSESRQTEESEAATGSDTTEGKPSKVAPDPWAKWKA